MTSKSIVIAFDLYGTILSTESIGKELAQHFGDEKAATLAATWRKYQLEYTWRANSMKKFPSFSTITQHALHHTLGESSLTLPQSSIESLMRSYDSLNLFPDVGPALSSLLSQQQQQITSVIFSNGTPAMVSASVHKSPDLSPFASVFKDIVTVEEVGMFKPAPEVYEHLARKVGKEGKMSEVVLVSGNPFDVVGAKAMGLKAIWVDRAGGGWHDALVTGEEGTPDGIVKGLGEVVDFVEAWLA